MSTSIRIDGEDVGIGWGKMFYAVVAYAFGHFWLTGEGDPEFTLTDEHVPKLRQLLALAHDPDDEIARVGRDMIERIKKNGKVTLEAF